MAMRTKIKSEPGLKPLTEVLPNPKTSVTLSVSPPGATKTCVHHWIIKQTYIHYERPKAKGDLIEDVEQVCKKCGETQRYSHVIPTDFGAWRDG